MACSPRKNRKNINIIQRILTWSEGKALASRRILYRFAVGLKNDSCNKMYLLRKALMHNLYMCSFYTTLAFYNLQHYLITYLHAYQGHLYQLGLYPMNYKEDKGIGSYQQKSKFGRQYGSDKIKLSNYI